MSTTLNCPDCDEKVTLKPGRSSAKCPACGSSISADRPAARGGRRRDDDDEDDDREERSEKKKPKRKYREEWDDDDDDDERRPPPKPKSSLAWLWITLTIVLVLLAGCGGLGWWIVTTIGQAAQNARQRILEDQQRMEQQMNVQAGNPQGRPKPPPQNGIYPKKKPFEVDPQMNKAGPVYLDDLEPFDVKQGSWPLGRHGALGYDDRWVCVNGQYYDHGIGLIPPDRGAARVSFAVGGQARRLKGQVALNDFWHDNDSWDEVTFAIYKDGKEVWRSQPTKKKKIPQPFDIDISGARVIMIETNAPNSAHDAHCVWLDPVLEK